MYKILKARYRTSGAQIFTQTTATKNHSGFTAVASVASRRVMYLTGSEVDRL